MDDDPIVADSLSEFLRGEGWAIRGVRREPGKRRFSIYVRGRDAPGPVPVEDRIDASPELRGEPYWEEI